MYIIKLAIMEPGQSANELKFKEHFSSDNPNEVVEEWKRLAGENFYKYGADDYAPLKLNGYVNRADRPLTHLITGEFGKRDRSGKVISGGYGIRMRIEYVESSIRLNGKHLIGFK